MMRFLYLTICISFFFSLSAIADDEIVLQNDGTYNGCTDAYIHSQESSTNFGDAADMMVEGPS